MADTGCSAPVLTWAHIPQTGLVLIQQEPSLGPRLGETFKGNTRRVYKEEAAKGAFANALARF